MTGNYRYDSRLGYAKAYGYDSAEAYEQARANYEDIPDWGDGLGSGHHPALCSERCPCKKRQDADQVAFDPTETAGQARAWQNVKSAKDFPWLRADALFGIEVGPRALKTALDEERARQAVADACRRIFSV